MPSLRTRRAVAVALVALLGLIVALPVAAEAPSHRVILSYVPTMSNWGPTTANGVVLISYAEGDVRADLVGLPVLGDSERYQLWLMKSDTGEAYPLARFNAAESGTTYVDQLLPNAIPDEGWDLVAVTVQPEPDPSPAPDARRAIVGSIPGTPAEIQQFPPSLPQTGVAPEPSRTSWLLGPLTGGAAILGLLAWRIIRRRTRVVVEER